MKKTTSQKEPVIKAEQSKEVSLAEICRVTHLSTETIFELVEHGVIEPAGDEPTQWRFPSYCMSRVLRVYRLQTDLGLNTAGAALAMELLDELQQLRSRLRQLERSR